MSYRGLTWDHPRGRNALERVALATDGLISWDVHSLEGFESSSIAALARQYDVIVLDHPHLGDALDAECLRPVEEWLGAEQLTQIADDALGPSLESYRVEGRTWALPLDTAAQVSARLPEHLAYAPQTWTQVLEFAQTAPVALSLAGPHAFLSYLSICVALGESPAVDGSPDLVSEATGTEAIRIMMELAALAPAGTSELNPIDLLERMRDARDIAYIPLIYGYVTYATGAGALAFGDAPEGPSNRIGSVIGGTGLAVTTRSNPDSRLTDMLAWLLHPLTQATVLPEHEGQPGSKSAWANPEVDRRAGGFYSGTWATLEASWVRPRLRGFTAFQNTASRVLRDALSSGDPRAAWHAIQHVYAQLLGDTTAGTPLEETR